MGWLHAIPERATSKGAAPAPRMSRLDKMKADGVEEVSLPQIPREAASVWGHLMDIGPASSTSMGDAAIGYADLVAWERLSGWPLTPWEAAVLRRLSRAYLAERAAGADPLRPAPWAAVTERQRDAVGHALAMNLRAMAQANRKEH